MSACASDVRSPGARSTRSARWRTSAPACRRPAPTAGARSRDGAVSERALVLLSGAESGAGGSGLDSVRAQVHEVHGTHELTEFADARSSAGDDDRISDARVRRGGRAARRRARLRDRSLRRARRSVAGPGDSDPLLRRGSASVGGDPRGGARRSPIDGVLVVGDRPTVIAARVAEALGLPGHPPEAAAVARNKLLTRERLRAARPARAVVSCAIVDRRPIRASWRRVGLVSRASSSRSRCRAAAASCAPTTRRASSPRSSGCARCCSRPTCGPSATRRTTSALVEGFIPGREFALEGLMNHGALHVLAIFDKPDPLDGPFFEETIYVTPSSAPRATRSARSSTPSARRRSGARSASRAGSRRVPRQRRRRVRARSRGAADRRPVRPRAAVRGRGVASVDSTATSPIRSRSCCCAMRSANRRTAGRREAAASGVMMIPIPRRGVFRGVDGRRRGAGGAPASTTCGSRRSRSAAACRCRKARATSASSSRAPTRPATVEARAARGARAAAVRDRSGTAVSSVHYNRAHG